MQKNNSVLSDANEGSDHEQFHDEDYLIKLSQSQIPSAGVKRIDNFSEAGTPRNSKQQYTLGIEKDFIKDLFLPKDKNFQQYVVDLTVEENRFLSYAFSWEMTDDKEGKQSKKKKKQSRSSVQVDPFSFSIVFVLDSRDQTFSKEW